jgi:alpha-tubulin suppressor-like RCC1 family protein
VRRIVAYVCLLALLPLGAHPVAAEQAGARPPRFLSGLIDAGSQHACVVMDTTFATWQVRCWGSGADGRLGYGNTDTVGDDEDPRDYGPVDLGTGRTARAVAGGGRHTCALLDDGTVRCWGYGLLGALGYGNTDSIGDDETPGSVGPVDLGPGRTAVAIAAGYEHTCTLMDNHRVRCWGEAERGALGYGNVNDIGDNETPGSVAPVFLGKGRTATAIAAGWYHTCAIRDDGKVLCWGYGQYGRLGYASQESVGDNETPGSVGPVFLGKGRTATAIAAGYNHTCAILDDGTVRCWGYGVNGELGYGNTNDIGDDEKPGSVGPVSLGKGRTAVAIAAGGGHTCAVLDDGTVRCWGYGGGGALGYGNTDDIGDDETPGSVGPVDLGPGRTARAITAGYGFTCASLDDGSVRCWGDGVFGDLGYGNTVPIGDDEAPGSVGPVNLGGSLFVRGASDLTLGVRPKSDTTLPVVFRAFGRLVPPTGPPLADACRGSVRITVDRHTTTIKRAKVGLDIVKGRCVYSHRFRFSDPKLLGKARRLSVHARFLGNELVKPSTAPGRTVRIA